MRDQAAWGEWEDFIEKYGMGLLCAALFYISLLAFLMAGCGGGGTASPALKQKGALIPVVALTSHPSPSPSKATPAPSSRPSSQGLICYTRAEVLFLVGRKAAYKELKTQAARLRREAFEARQEALRLRGELAKERVASEGWQRKYEGAAQQISAHAAMVPVWATVVFAVTGTVIGGVVGGIAGASLAPRLSCP